jgi:polyphosphate kinase 2 (PPK2 family)
MTGPNPQACRATAFKVPTEQELHNEFLWLVHNAMPRRTESGIFNRSRCEDVLATRMS